jgi:hypothetical protein
MPCIELDNDVYSDFNDILNLYDGEWTHNDLVREMIWWWNHR